MGGGASSPLHRDSLTPEAVIVAGEELIARRAYKGLRELTSSTTGLSIQDMADVAGTLLKEASERGQLECMELLIGRLKKKLGNDTKATVSTHCPLHAAAVALQPDAVDLLLSSGIATASDRDMWGMTALHRCCNQKWRPVRPGIHQLKQTIQVLPE